MLWESLTCTFPCTFLSLGSLLFCLHGVYRFSRAVRQTETDGGRERKRREISGWRKEISPCFCEVWHTPSLHLLEHDWAYQTAVHLLILNDFLFPLLPLSSLTHSRRTWDDPKLSVNGIKIFKCFTLTNFILIALVVNKSFYKLLIPLFISYLGCFLL